LRAGFYRYRDVAKPKRTPGTLAEEVKTEKAELVF
jgi:hypothetical protein